MLFIYVMYGDMDIAITKHTHSSRLAILFLHSDVDEYGFRRPDDFDYDTYERIMSDYYIVLATRRRKWEQLMQKHPDLHRHRRSGQLKRYVRKGIPAHLRAQVWMSISGAFAQQKKAPDLFANLLLSTFDADVGEFFYFFIFLVLSLHLLNFLYAPPLPTVESIKIDLPRTFPDNIFFEHHDIRLQLFHVLVAYAHHNKEVGYCQGLNYIAGLLLIVTKNEEWSFWLLKQLLDNTVRSYHTKTMEGLKIDTAVFRALLVQRAPQVNQRLEVVGLPCAVMSTKWLICMFAEVLPTETVLRIWDCIFLEGDKILFRVSLTLLVSAQLAIEQAEDVVALAGLLQAIVKGPEVIDCHRFVQSIFRVPGTLKRTDIERLRRAAVMEAEALRKK